MLASRNITGRPAAVQRHCVAAFRPAHIVSVGQIQRAVSRQWLQSLRSSCPSQAPVVARRPLVCQAAAEVIEAETVAAPKGGVAHLRFKRGSVHKVGATQGQRDIEAAVAACQQLQSQT